MGSSLHSLQGAIEYTEEVVCAYNTGQRITSGGGFSNYYTRPAYQDAAVEKYFAEVARSPIQPVAGYNPAGRGYPDISFEANMYRVQHRSELSSKWSGTSGTSASCPVAAGMFSNINAARLAAGKGSIGWINPVLYMYASLFVNDVTKGNNKDGPTCPHGFSATPGWDPTTGLGSINYGKLEAVMVSLGKVNSMLSYPSKNPASNLIPSPTAYPVSKPSGTPSLLPTNKLTARPSSYPTNRPFTKPSVAPMGRPSDHPTLLPSVTPSIEPTEKLTARPSRYPTFLPYVTPSVAPTENLTARPSSHPTLPPFTKPSVSEIETLTELPTKYPTKLSQVRKPSRRPLRSRTKRPSRSPLVVEFVPDNKKSTAQPSSFSPVTLSPELPTSETPSSGTSFPSLMFPSDSSVSSSANAIEDPNRERGTITLLFID